MNGIVSEICEIDEQRCGDGELNGVELCDDGANGDDTDGCTDQCDF